MTLPLWRHPEQQQIQFFLNLAHEDVAFIDSILWSNESKFTLSGTVTQHNCVIWSSTNPHFTFDHDFTVPLCSTVHLCIMLYKYAKLLISHMLIVGLEDKVQLNGPFTWLDAMWFLFIGVYYMYIHWIDVFSVIGSI